MNQHLISVSDLSGDEILKLIEISLDIKKSSVDSLRKNNKRPFEGKTIALIFEKPSLRTRVTFEAAIAHLGGYAIHLQQADIELGKRESPADIARSLERWVDCIVARTFDHKTIVELADSSKIPVVNALSDKEHPCQALAFAMTMVERRLRVAKVGNLKGLNMAFVGDGNNVAHSMMLLCPVVGMNFVISCPEGYGPDEEIMSKALGLASDAGTRMEIVENKDDAVRNADVIYTDTWTSMGQEDEAEERSKAFCGYQVNMELLDKAKNGCLVSHCLPAYRGKEITDEVLDSPRSIAFDEAENKLYVQKAVLLRLLK